MKKLLFSTALSVLGFIANSQCIQTAQINVSADPLILCNPSTETLTANVGVGTYDFIQWVRTDVNPVQVLATGTSLVADRWTIGNIAVRVWCSGSFIQSPNTNINRFDIEVPIGQSTLLCFGQAADLSVPNVPGLTYKWSVGNSPGGAAVSTSPNYTTASTTNIWCQITQPVGSCSKLAKFRLNKPKDCEAVTLKTPENPYLICQNQYGFLTPTIPGGGSFDSVQWFRNGTYFKQADTLFLDRWSVGDFYAQAWFLGTISNTTNVVPVNRFDIRIKNGDGVLCGSETVTLVAPSIHQPVYYEWSVGDPVGANMVLQGNVDSIFTTSYIGNVWCMITHDGGCFKYAKFRVLEDLNCTPGAKSGVSYKMDDMENMENGTSMFDMAIFPNPNRGMFKIAIDGLESNSKIVVEIYDMSGRKVFDTYQMSSSTQEVLEINNSNFAAGVYSVRVVNSNNTISSRMIVE
jgi:hypothetical protein